MKTENLNVVFPEGYSVAELIIREGQPVMLLDPKAPVKLTVKGTIDAPVEFLTRRVSEVDQVPQKRCMVYINREKISIMLVTNEHDDYLQGKIIGILEFHPKYKEFGINTDKEWNPNQLGQFFKMNRAFFPDKENNMSLVTQLKNFEAKINSIIQKQKAESGDFADNYSGIVTSNVPSLFMIRIPIFKGTSMEDLEVEFYVTVSGREIKLQLYSPGANQVTEEIRDKVIDEQIAKIRALAPDIAIIEE